MKKLRGRDLAAIIDLAVEQYGIQDDLILVYREGKYINRNHYYNNKAEKIFKLLAKVIDKTLDKKQRK